MSIHGHPLHPFEAARCHSYHIPVTDILPDLYSRFHRHERERLQSAVYHILVFRCRPVEKAYSVEPFHPVLVNPLVDLLDETEQIVALAF